MSKPNIIDFSSMTHNNSLGWYYSFRNRDCFKKIGNSSVGQYFTKRRHSENGQKEVDAIANDIENTMAVEIKNGMKSLSTVISNLCMFIAPILDII